MKKIIVQEIKKTVTEIFKRKVLGECEKELENKIIDSYVVISCDDDDEAKVISLFLREKGYSNFSISYPVNKDEDIQILFNSDDNEANSKMFWLVRDNFKFSLTK